jgi:cyclopropane fatty-acyl-phospholipid synthase-like methyltransferase
VSLEDVGTAWQTLGREDPLWAVFVAPGTRGGAWDVEEFLRTGRVEVDAAMSALAAHGLPAGHEVALDFGCGVGRLSNALAAHFERVLGVDVAPSMLEHARRLDRSQGRAEWVLNERPDLAVVPDASVDLAYSSLVLQHLPRTLAEGYLAELVRVVRPGGAVVVQTVTRPTASPKGVAAAVLPVRVQAYLQRRVLGYPAPMLMTPLPARRVARIAREAGAEVVQVTRDQGYGGHWVCRRFVLRKDA